MNTVKSKMEDSTGESIFFIPFNLFYYFGFVPFKTYHNEDNKYQVQTNIVQKVICAFFHVVQAIYQVYFFLKGCLQFKSSSETSTVALLDAVSNFAFLVANLLVMQQMWRRPENYLQFLEYTRCKRKPGKCGGSFCVYTTMILCCLFLSVVSWFLVNDPEYFINHTSPLNNNTSTVQDSASRVRNESNFQLYFDKGMQWGNSVLYISTANFFVFTQGLFIVLILALRQRGAEFRIEMDKSRENADIKQGIQLYRKLKRTTDLTQKMYGDYMLAFYISSVSYYAEAPHILMGKRSAAEMVILIVFTITSLVWIWAAGFHYCIHNCIGEWMAFFNENDSILLEDQLKLLSISSEVSTDPIALSCRCFSVTYKHLCSMLGVVATYGMIVVQLNRD